MALLLAMITHPAAAHAVGDHGADWNFEPWLVVSLGVVALLYGIGCVRVRRRTRRGSVVGAGAIAAFGGTMVTLILALASPIDSLSAELFSVHMCQHLLLMLVAAPLAAFSRLGLVMLWGLPRRLRSSLGGWRNRAVGRAIEGLGHPLSAWLLFCAAFVFWHLPGPYRWAWGNEFVHVVEHVCLFCAAFAFWSVVIQPSARRHLDYGMRLLFVATMALLSSLPGALMFLAARPLYDVHAMATAAFGLSALQDQQLAGLIMWVPAGLVYLAAIAVLFVRWLDDATRLNERRSHVRRSDSELVTMGL